MAQSGNCSRDIPLTPAPVGFDAQSPAGGIEKNVWRLLLNLIHNREGDLVRLGGWRRRGWELVPEANADLHDQLLNALPPLQPACRPPGNLTIQTPPELVVGQPAEFIGVAQGDVDFWEWTVTPPVGAPLTGTGATLVVTPLATWANGTVTVQVRATKTCSGTLHESLSGAVSMPVRPVDGRIRSVTATANPVPANVGQAVVLTGQSVPDFVFTDQWQWWKDGAAIPGATANGYGLSAGPGRDGYYSVSLTRNGERTMSNTVQVRSVCAAMTAAVTGPAQVTDAQNATWTFLAQSVDYAGAEFFDDRSELFVDDVLVASAAGRQAQFVGIIPAPGLRRVSGRHIVGGCTVGAVLQVTVTEAGGPTPDILGNVEMVLEATRSSNLVRFSTVQNPLGAPMTIRWTEAPGAVPGTFVFVNLLINDAAVAVNWNSGVDQTVPSGGRFRVELALSPARMNAVLVGETWDATDPVFIRAEMYQGLVRVGSVTFRVVNLIPDT
jgi:hypothetical protein